jgi:hypothetical protein
MSNLCQYRNIFGKPNEGIHKTRFMSLAAMDLIGMILIIVFISYYWQTGLVSTTIIVSIITIIIHYLFCVPTAFNKFIGLADEINKIDTNKIEKPTPNLAITVDGDITDYVII